MSQVLFSKIRSIVSADRHRFKSGDLDLDLSYITDNILAMSIPSTGLESTWRNSIDDICALLKQNHNNKFMIWNLSERVYDYSKLNNQILEFPFYDHHAPTLNLLFEIVNSLDNWLKADSENIAVVHCKGGKGRTGCIIVCYLYYSGQFDSIEESMQHFALKRSKTKKGVTQPSQQRYINYFKEIVSGNHMVEEFTLTFRSLELGPLTRDQANQISIEIFEHAKEPILQFQSSQNSITIVPIDNNNENIDNSINNNNNNSSNNNEQLYKIVLVIQKKISNDVLIRVYRGDTGKGKAKMKNQIFHLIFNIAFINFSMNSISFGAKDLDHFKSSKNYDKNLRIDCRFQNNCSGQPDHSFKIWNIMSLKYQKTKLQMESEKKNNQNKITTINNSESLTSSPIASNNNSLNNSLTGNISSSSSFENLNVNDNSNNNNRLSTSSNLSFNDNTTTTSTSTNNNNTSINNINNNDITLSTSISNLSITSSSLNNSYNSLGLNISNSCDSFGEIYDDNEKLDASTSYSTTTTTTTTTTTNSTPVLERKRKNTLWAVKTKIKPSPNLSRFSLFNNHRISRSQKELKNNSLINTDNIDNIDNSDNNNNSNNNNNNNNNNNSIIIEAQPIQDNNNNNNAECNNIDNSSDILIENLNKQEGIQ